MIRFSHPSGSKELALRRTNVRRSKPTLIAIGSAALLGISLTGITAGGAALPDPVRINAGGDEVSAYGGVTWEADKYFSGGQRNSTNQPIGRTLADEIYETERWGDFSYDIPLDHGTYTVKLHFVEINPSSGNRVINVTAEGSSVVDGLNVSETVGDYTAHVDVSRVGVTDGKLTLRFTSSANSASVSGIEILPLSSSVASVTTTTVRSTTTVRPTTTTARPATTTTRPPAPSPSGSPSGVALPVGDLDGWRQIFREDFTTEVPIGRFPGSAYSDKWEVYADGWRDTAGNTENGIGRYFPSKVLSVQDGVLNKSLRVENGVALGAAIMPKIPSYGQTYGRYTVRFRADPVPGFKMAWLLWPDSDNWARGEIDFPEGDLGGTIQAFNHCIGSPQNNCFYADTDTRFTSWHTATTEWQPGRITYLLDGRVVGTTTNSVPNTSMHWVLQTETCMGGCQPGPSARGNVQIDWVAMYSRA